MKLLSSAGAQINEALALMQQDLEPADFTLYAKATGEVLGVIALDLMRPVWRAHPDLDPDRPRGH